MVLNIAHRGARSLAPENTLAAARKALSLGADLWETDLAVTKDGALILFHDDSLARTTDAAARIRGRALGPFTEYTLAEIRALDAGSWFAAQDPHGQIAAGAVSEGELASYRGEKVPTLAEALRFTIENGWRMNLELKRLPAPCSEFPVPERVLALVDEVGAGPEHVLFSSARFDWLEAIRLRRPEFAVEALIGVLPTDPIDYRGYGFPTYNIRHTLVPEAELRGLLARGRAVNLYTVNEEADMRRFAALGVAGLITDFPQRLAGLKSNGAPR